MTTRKMALAALVPVLAAAAACGGGGSGGPVSPGPTAGGASIPAPEAPAGLSWGQPADLMDADGGAVMVWAVRDGGELAASDLVFQRVTSAGEPLGAVRVLAHVEADVEEVGVVRTSSAAAAVWCGPTGEAEYLYGLVRFDAEGRIHGEPIVLGTVDREWPAYDPAAGCTIEALADGDDVIVLRASGTTRCDHGDEDDEDDEGDEDDGSDAEGYETGTEDCSEFAVERVTLAGTVERLSTGGILAPEGPITSPVRTAAGMAYAMPETHIALKTYMLTHSLRREEAAVSDYGDVHGGGTTLATLYAGTARLAWTGDALVAIGRSDYGSDALRLADWPDGRSADDGPATEDIESLPAVTRHEVLCGDGGIRVVMADETGREVTLDPARGASFRWRDVLPPRDDGSTARSAAWTGEAMLVVWIGDDHQDRDVASVSAYACEDGRIPVAALR